MDNAEVLEDLRKKIMDLDDEIEEMYDEIPTIKNEKLLNSIKNKIIALEEKMKALELEYEKLVKPCENTSCNYYSEKELNHCRRMYFINTCVNYK